MNAIEVFSSCSLAIFTFLLCILAFAGVIEPNPPEGAELDIPADREFTEALELAVISTDQALARYGRTEPSAQDSAFVVIPMPRAMGKSTASPFPHDQTYQPTAPLHHL